MGNGKTNPGYGEHLWRLEHWGSKWDLLVGDFQIITSSSDLFEAHFQTAWSPPLAAIATLAARFPCLSFSISYCEADNEISGEQIFPAAEMSY